MDTNLTSYLICRFNGLVNFITNLSSITYPPLASAEPTFDLWGAVNCIYGLWVLKNFETFGQKAIENRCLFNKQFSGTGL